MILFYKKIRVKCICLIISIPLFYAIITSCSPRIVERLSVDSVYVDRVVTIHDTVINVMLPDEIVSNRTLDTVSHLETSIAVSDASYSDGVLTHSLRNKQTALPVVVKLPREAIYTRTVTLVKDAEIREVEKPLSWWQKTMIYLAAGIILAAALKVMIRIIFNRRE